MANKRILVIGYGNPGRGDDGLGPALAARMEQLELPNVTIESDYQLTVEHAALAAEHDIVIFADAALDIENDPYYFKRVNASNSSKFSSHSVTPGEVMLLAQQCFSAAPPAYALGMRAPVLSEFGEGLSAEAQANLESALQFLLHFIADQGE
jgi:hydrogenase maturation protease